MSDSIEDLNKKIRDKRLADYRKGKVRRSMLDPKCVSCLKAKCYKCSIFKRYIGEIT